MNNAAEKADLKMEKNEYYSAEFSIKGLAPYQFRLRNTDSTSMGVLVREDSNIIPWLKVGHVFNIKYYTTDSSYAPQFLETEISNITKGDNGRFKGHYLVELEILEEQERQCA